ncbi:MAG TPA: hypothetical protein VH208_08305, partial [Myxococcaceae bacterium]|nr:hypothetical protein [Myxococcaceae bacterium]
MNAWKALALGVVMGFVVSVGYGCSGSTKCDASNCQGCCDTNHKCIATASQTSAQCGSSGNACQACQTGQACNPAASGGSCGACSGSSCDGGACNPNNCPAGCCSAGQCISSIALSNSLCGAGGQACQACTGGTSCSLITLGGVCTADAGGSGGVGAPCTTNANCSAQGPGATCLTSTSTGVTYVGGFCTFDCSQAACPGLSQCV